MCVGEEVASQYLDYLVETVLALESKDLSSSSYSATDCKDFFFFFFNNFFISELSWGPMVPIQFCFSLFKNLCLESICQSSPQLERRRVRAGLMRWEEV